MFRLVATVAMVAFGTSASAISYDIDTYYYLGGPAIVRNVEPYPLDDHPPGLDLNTPITGIIQVDRKGAPGGSLANQTLGDDPFAGGAEPEWAYDVFQQAVFDCCDQGNGIFFWSMKFDRNSRLEDFSFESGGRSVDIYEEWAVGLGGAHLYRDPYPQSFWVDEFAREYLTDLGYEPGTEAYAQLFCGSWVSESHAESCLRRQEDDSGVNPTWASHAWGALLITGPGTLYSSFSEFTSAYRAAVTAPQPPARSYADIPVAPIPVPAPLLSMLAGLATFAAPIAILRMRRT